MESLLEMIVRLLNLIRTGEGLVPRDVKEDLSEALRTARRNGDRETLIKAEKLLSDFVAHVNPGFDSVCLGRLLQMLDNVEAELKQIDNMQQVELTYNEARVLKALLRFSPQDTNHLHGFIGRISRTRLLQTCRRLEELGLAGKTIVSPGGLASWYITDVGRGHRQLDELATGRA